MSIVTGSALDTSVAAVDTAFGTYLTTSNQTNFDALVAACATVATNGRDSRFSITETTTGRLISKDIGALAKRLHRDLLTVATKGSATDAGTVQNVKRLRRSTDHTFLIRYAARSTTT